MRLWLRPLLTVMAFALAMQAELPVTEFICRYTGHRMPACCCDSEQDQSNAPTVKSPCCCDVRVTSSSVDPRLVETSSTPPTSPVLWVALLPTPPRLLMAASPALDLPTPAIVERPPDRGRAVYLLVNRLLI